MAIRKVEAIVLKRIPFRESSLLVTLFGREVGKLIVLAKGVRKDKRLRVASFEPFTHLTVLYYEKTKSEIHLFSDLSVLASNSFLRLKLDHFTYASYLIELVDTFLGVYDPHAEVFDLLLESFLLFKVVLPLKVTCGFEIKFFGLIGWLPVLDRCTSCGDSNFDRCFFSAKQGGILCPRCERSESGTIPISGPTAQALLELSRKSLKEVVGKELDYQTLRELERLSQRFISFRLDYPLKSRQVLSEIQSFLQKK